MNTEGYIQRIQICVCEDISHYWYKYILETLKRVSKDILSRFLSQKIRQIHFS